MSASDVERLANDIANRIESTIAGCESHNIECGKLKRMHAKLKTVNGDKGKLLQAVVEMQ